MFRIRQNKILIIIMATDIIAIFGAVMPQGTANQLMKAVVASCDASLCLHHY